MWLTQTQRGGGKARSEEKDKEKKTRFKAVEAGALTDSETVIRQKKLITEDHFRKQDQH